MEWLVRFCEARRFRRPNPAPTQGKSPNTCPSRELPILYYLRSMHSEHELSLNSATTGSKPMLKGLTLVLALQSADAFAPLVHGSPFTARTTRSSTPLVMKGPSDAIGPLYRKRLDKKTGKFIREQVSEEAVNKTVTRLVLFQAAGAALLGGAFAANIAKGNNNVGSPPGYEEAAKAKAEKKAAFIASEKARQAALAERACELDARRCYSK